MYSISVNGSLAVEFDTLEETFEALLEEWTLMWEATYDPRYLEAVEEFTYPRTGMFAVAGHQYSILERK